MGSACSKDTGEDVVEMGGLGASYSPEEQERVDEQNSGKLSEWHGALLKFRNEAIFKRELLCIACVHFLYEPVTMPCGHTYCNTCLKQLNRVRKDCAACGKELPAQSEWKGAKKETYDAVKAARPDPEEKARGNLTKFKTKTELSVDQLQNLDRAEFVYGVWGETGKVKYQDKPVAYKRTVVELSKSVMDHFEKKIQAYATHRHPSLCLMIGAVPTPQGGIVSEWCENGSVYNLMTVGKFRIDMNIYLNIVRDVASALNYLHCNGVYHGALNTQQILIDHRFRVKVNDYGYMRVRDHVRQNMTILGNARYFGPEIHQSDKKKGIVHNPSLSDMYAFGIVLWEMYTLLPPFPLWSDAQLITNLIFKRTRPRVPGHCPAGLKTLMEECWAEDPKDRPTFYQIAAKKLPPLVEAHASAKSLIPLTNPNDVHDEETVEKRDHLAVIKDPDAVPTDITMEHTLRFQCILDLQDGLSEKIVLETSVNGITGYSWNSRNRLVANFQHSWVHVRAFTHKGDNFQYFWIPSIGNYERRFRFRGAGLGKIIYDRCQNVMAYLTRFLLEIRKKEKAAGKGSRTKLAVESARSSTPDKQILADADSGAGTGAAAAADTKADEQVPAAASD